MTPNPRRQLVLVSLAFACFCILVGIDAAMLAGSGVSTPRLASLILALIAVVLTGVQVLRYWRQLQ
jgi:hypothetical protein